MAMSKKTRGTVLLVGIVAGYAIGTIVAVRRGYTFGRNVPVECQRGHQFRTTWIPGASITALKLGPWRVQWCPAGRHVALIHPVKPGDLA
ncbi:MAG TPA: hypothetical protein VGG75_15510 [Trebonia sp.]